MLTLEEKIAKRKRSDCIFVVVAWIVITILAMQFYRVYISYDKFNITQMQELLDKVTYNLQNDFFFPVNKEYMRIISITTIGCFVWLLMKLDNTKKYMKGVEHGSARFADKKEKNKFKDEDENNNAILSKDIRMSLDGRKSQRNLNQLTIGGSGTGKTTNIILPNLLQANASYVLTDPKGELFAATGKFMKEQGYKIKVVNLKNMEESMCYNPFHYAKNEQDIFKIIKNLIKNTNDGKNSGEAFWELAETALDNAICMYIREELKKEEQIFPNVLKLLRAMKCSEENENFKSPLDVVFDKLEKKKGDNSIAIRQWKIFKSASGKTSKSIQISAMARMAFLDIPAVKKIFSRDELELEKLGQEKTILYLILSDTDSTYNFIASMLYSQILDILVNEADTKGLKYPVRLLLDEFANIPAIPDFEKVLATIRSRGISATIILQSIAQIKGAYKENWESIVDNCDATIFLGGKSSCEYISKQLGNTTIDTVSLSKSGGRNGTSVNEGILGRELMTAEELARMDNKYEIVLIRGCNPMLDNKFKLKKHKNYKYLGDAKDKKNKNTFTFDMLERDEVKVNNFDVSDTIFEKVDKEKLTNELLNISSNLELELDGVLEELDDYVEN